MSNAKNVLHTLSFEDAIESLTQVCIRNRISYFQTSKNMILSAGQIKMMQEDLYSELIQILMEKWNLGMEKAMEVFYNSDTFSRLQDVNTGWYYQSAGYVYSYLEKEITTGDYRK